MELKRLWYLQVVQQKNLCFLLSLFLGEFLTVPFRMGGRHLLVLVYMVASNLSHLISLSTSNKSLQDDFSKLFVRFSKVPKWLPRVTPSKQCVSTVVTAGCFVEQVLGHETLRSNSFGGICRVEFLLKASTYSKNSYDFGVNNFFRQKIIWVGIFWRIEKTSSRRLIQSQIQDIAVFRS